MSDAIDLLKSIDKRLERLVALLSHEQRQAQSSAPKEIAPASDLDSKYGDPEIKAKDPRDWTGPPMKGRKFSQCPPDYLDLVADRLDYFAEQAEAEGKLTTTGKPVAPYNRKDAARARGWAKRMRDGVWETPTVDSVESDSGWASVESQPSDDDIPFAWLLPIVLPMALACLGAVRT